MTKSNLAPTLQSAVTSTNDIRGIKPLVEIPNEWLWVWIALGVLALAAVAVAAWLRWRKKLAMPPPIPIIPPHVRAKQRLAEALNFLSDPNKFCTLVADTARVYLEERFQLRAPERTTEEFLVELQTSRHLTRDQKQSLGEFLQSCDLVKFARFEPNESSLRQLHDAALRLVDETQFDPIGIPPTSPSAPPDGNMGPPFPPSATAESTAPAATAERKS
jgi:hypothetical protein